MASEHQSVTRLLQQWGSGSKEALDELMPAVYEQLHQLASRCLRAERPDHTLRATALVHEAYLRLIDADVAWQDRVHFFAVSARILRRILVDQSKDNHRQKRGAGRRKSHSMKPSSWVHKCQVELSNWMRHCKNWRCRISARVNSSNCSALAVSPMTRLR